MALGGNGSPGLVCQTMDGKSTVLLVDDHAVVRLGLTVLLEEQAQFRVCGEAADVVSARRLTEELQPGYIVLDMMLGGRDGIELIEDLLVLHAPARILVYTSLNELAYARRALRAGARGYVMKSASFEQLTAALLQVAQGELSVSDSVTRTLIEQCAGATGTALDVLSDRELQIYRLLGGGLDTASIAKELCLSMKTVGTYRERLKNKLGLHSARELERNAESFVANGNDPRAARAS
jgi:DNA-binding NarL/FixJ family response regulator